MQCTGLALKTTIAVIFCIAACTGAGVWLIDGRNREGYRGSALNPSHLAIESRQLVRAAYADAEYAGDIAYEEITEASGMAASRLGSEVLWVVNDSDNAPMVFAVGLKGRALGKFRLRNAPARDWEDMASFQWDNQCYLIIGDFGDNNGKRRSVTLHIVREPHLSDLTGDSEVLDPAWSIRYRYEDGPRDCEAVAVDSANGRIFLLSKRDVPATIYELDLRAPSDNSVQVAKRVAFLTGIPQPTVAQYERTSLDGRFRAQLTAMDISPDGSAAIVLAYRNAYLYKRQTGQTWVDVFSGDPQLIPLPPLYKGESICFAPDGQTIYVTSEWNPAPLFRVRSLGKPPAGRLEVDGQG